MKNFDKAIQHAEETINNCFEEMQKHDGMMVTSAYVVGKSEDGVVPMPYRNPKEKEAMTVALGEISRQMQAEELFFACQVTVVDGGPGMTMEQVMNAPADDRRKGISITYIDLKAAAGFLMTQEFVKSKAGIERRRKTFEQFTEADSKQNYLFSLVLQIWRGERNIVDTIGSLFVGKSANLDPMPDDPFHGIDMDANPDDPRFPESERA